MGSFGLRFLDVSPSIVFSPHWPTLPAFFADLLRGVPWQHWHLPPQKADVLTWKIPWKIHSKSTGNLWKSMEIYGNPWKSMEIPHGNLTRNIAPFHVTWSPFFIFFHLKNTTSSINRLSAIETLNRGSRSRIFFRICARNTWYERIFSLISCFLSLIFLRSSGRNKKWSIMKQYFHARWSNQTIRRGPLRALLAKIPGFKAAKFQSPQIGKLTSSTSYHQLGSKSWHDPDIQVTTVNRICIVVYSSDKSGTVSDSWYLTILYHLEPPWSLRSPFVPSSSPWETRLRRGGNFVDKLLGMLLGDR